MLLLLLLASFRKQGVVRSIRTEAILALGAVIRIKSSVIVVVVVVGTIKL